MSEKKDFKKVSLIKLQLYPSEWVSYKEYQHYRINQKRFTRLFFCLVERAVGHYAFVQLLQRAKNERQSMMLRVIMESKP